MSLPRHALRLGLFLALMTVLGFLCSQNYTHSTFNHIDGPLLLTWNLKIGTLWVCLFAFVCGQVFFLDRSIKAPFFAAHALFSMGLLDAYTYMLRDASVTSDFSLFSMTSIRLFGVLSLSVGLISSRMPQTQDGQKNIIIIWEVFHYFATLLMALFLSYVATSGISLFLQTEGSLSYATIVLLVIATMGPARDYIRRVRGYFGHFVILFFSLLFVSQIAALTHLEDLAELGQLLAYMTLFVGVLFQAWAEYKKDQQALFLLADTQGLLAERKFQLEHANKKLTKINEEFKRANEKTSLIIETANDAFIAIDASGVVSEWNRQAEMIFGWQREEAIGKKLVSIIIPEVFKIQLEADIRKFFSTGTDPVVNRQIEVTAIHRDAHEFPAELSISILKNERGYSFNAFVRDITARKKAEEEIEKRAEDLARSNADLEQFAYVASHDLQEPLRMVGSYTQLLARKYKGKIDKDADEFIGFAVDGVKRMQQLINDLLEYSRVGTKKRTFTQFSLNQVIKNSLENLQVAIAESSATINVPDNLPQVQGDEVQLTQLFQNLIGNAVKFRGSNKPIIDISATIQNGAVLVRVGDNGIGIDPRFKEKIFVIFQRLHAAKEYAGTGIGLALCKKIVERHQGHIWVESELGQGTNFFFTLPREAGEIQNA